MRGLLRILCIALAAACLPFALLSCGGGEGDYAVKLGGYEVRSDLYRFAVRSEREALESKYGEDFSKAENRETISEEIRSGALGYLKNLYAIVSLCGEMNIRADDPAISDSVDRMIAADEAQAGGERELNASLEEQGMTRDVYRFLAEVSVMSDELYYALINSGRIDDDPARVRDYILGDDCVRVAHILITTGERTDAEALGIARTVRELCDSGAPFDKLLAEYGEDTSLFGAPSGYYLMRGVKYLPFEEAAFALSEGEVSDPVRTPAGYSVVKRLKKDESYVSNHLDSLTDDYCDAAYCRVREERAAALEVTDPAKADKIDVMSLN